MSLPELAVAALEEAMNRYLQLDPAAPEQLAALHGRVLAFEIVGLGQTIFLIPGPQRIQIMARFEGEPDCRLRGTPLALARLGDERGSSEQLFSGGVEISGDTELAHRFGKILGAMDIDWEEQLARLTGDLVAHELGNLVRGGMRWGRESRRTLGLDLKEYLQEELRMVPSRPDVEGFLHEVDEVRDGVERLEARIERLRRIGAGS